MGDDNRKTIAEEKGGKRSSENVVDKKTTFTSGGAQIPKLQMISAMKHGADAELQRDYH